MGGWTTTEESKFKDDEIRKHVRQAVTKRKNIDYDPLPVRRELQFAARTDTPEEFQARIEHRGIDLGPEHGKKGMEAYWAIRRELQR